MVWWSEYPWAGGQVYELRIDQDVVAKIVQDGSRLFYTEGQTEYADLDGDGLQKAKRATLENVIKMEREASDLALHRIQAMSEELAEVDEEQDKCVDRMKQRSDQVIVNLVGLNVQVDQPLRKAIARFMLDNDVESLREFVTSITEGFLDRRGYWDADKHTPKE